MAETLVVIKTLADLHKLEEYLQGKEYVAFDTETTGLEYDAKIIGFSICADVEVAYYVVLAYWDVQQQKLIDLETLPGAHAVIKALAGKDLVMHNATADCIWTKSNFGIDLMPSVHTDTMILAHLLDENRHVGLKDLGISVFGQDANKEQQEMRASVTANGGMLTKACYELYKADADLIAKYGAKDALLTLSLFYHMVPQLIEQGLDKFFYDEESMPLLRGPTYDLNTSGLRVDPDRLQQLKITLEAECLEDKAYIDQEIAVHVKDKYPGTSAAKTFNVGAGQQRAWLLYTRLGNEFNSLTDSGRELCKAIDLKVPYTPSAKREFIAIVTQLKGHEWAPAKYNPKTKKMGKPKKVADPWAYMTCGKESLGKLANKYRWVERLLEYNKNLKLLNTYVEGIQAKMRYGVIRPSFLQHGTTSGRYSSRAPNFQNLPREDKRIKSCIVARPGKVLVGADYAQLEPRVFASFSQDVRLMACFERGEDFYSVVGAPIFGKTGLPLEKDNPNSFAKRHPDLRDKSKVVALATPYGRTANQQSAAMGIPREESQYIIDRYWEEYPKVQDLMLSSHSQAKTHGVVYNLFGRPRRIPAALKIKEMYGDLPHEKLPYDARNLLNLAMNHPIQSTGASIMNRAAIACWREVQVRAKTDPAWKEVKVILQVHDELVLEGPERLVDAMVAVLKDAMQNTVTLPGVALLAEPKAGYNLAELK